MPSHPVAHALLLAAQLPIAAPSANLFSRPSPTTAAHVRDDLNGRIDMILDGGPTTVGIESTVIDLTRDPPEVLRPGAVTLEALRSIVPAVGARRAVPLHAARTSAPSGEAMASPGLLPKHYAPRAPLTLYRGRAELLRDALVSGTRAAISRGLRVGVLAMAEDVAALQGLPVAIAHLGQERDVEHVAARLYAALRELDAQEVDVILARELPEPDGLARAIQDRLGRAAAEVVQVD
jgi:L-threonylcarbamoyladenylate synthase